LKENTMATAECFLFEKKDLDALKIIKARLYDDRGISPDQRRDLAASMECALDGGVPVDTSDKPPEKMIYSSHHGREMEIKGVLYDLASQEGCDGEPWDQMVEAAQYIAQLENMYSVEQPGTKPDHRPGTYRHNKTGDIYYVVGSLVDCTNERDGTVCVLYRNKGGLKFVREIREFLGKFTRIGDIPAGMSIERGHSGH
jgi:hypothetical protein